MRKKLIAVIAALVLVVALVPVAVMAEPDMASRDLPDSVLVDTEFDVTITLDTTFGNVVETLPAGFSYVSCEAGSNMPEGGVEGEIIGIGEVKFTFFALATPATFTYTVEAPSSPVTGAEFSGVIKTGPVTEEPVVGDDTMDVVSDAVVAAASRGLPDSVLVNDEFDVTITLQTTFGNVVETLPADFTYVSCEAGSNMPEGGVEGEITGVGEVTFTFFATATPATFTYIVEAPSSPVTGAEFSGVIKYGSPVTEEAVIGDDTMDVVPEAVVAAAVRSLPDSVLVNQEFDVTITLETTFGNVVETLPADFTYVSCEAGSNMPVGGVEGEIIGVGEVKFTFFATATPATFTYEVEAPSSPVTGAEFSGVIKYGDPVTEEDVIGDDTMDVASAEPEEVYKEFSGSLAKGQRVTLPLTSDIPAGATDLDIALTATADIDLELHYGDILVIGWKAEIDSVPGGTYQDDTFAYSGYDGGNEYITAAGPLKWNYTLKVYGYKAGDYVVTVSYIAGVPPDVTPPEITINAPDATVGVPATITVSATDPSDVGYIWFGVWTPGAPTDWEQALIMGMGPGGEVSVTFTPPSEFAGTYEVRAWAGDTEGNWTPDAEPETTTFEVVE